MKLILVLSIIAYGYADKLDRAYLPPTNAASSGGSPGSLIAPAVQPEGFGQGLPVSGGQQGLSGFGKPITSQNGISGHSQNNPGTATFGSTFNPNGVENNRVASSDNGYGTSTGINVPSGSNSLAPNAIQQFSSNGFSASNQNFPSSGVQSTPGRFNQGLAQEAQGSNAQVQRIQERPQAAAERNAETLKYINENNGESYAYSYETSNGIFAEESGIATNGVMAQGGYAYTGDDGKAYSVSYTADENGYQPQGEHLPTPHPIPEEILKSIEENAKAAAAGIQEGAYRPEEYESEVSSQQYNFGSGVSYQSKSDQEKSPTSNPTQINQYQTTNQEQNLPIGQSGQDSLAYQQYNKGAVSGQGITRLPYQGKSEQNNQGIIQKSSQSYRPRPYQSQAQGDVGGQFFNQSPNLGSTTQNFGQFTQGQGSGYQYNQPQNAFQPTTFTQGTTNQYRPSGQGQNTFSSGPSATGSVFKGNQDTLKPSLGNRPSTDLYRSQQFQSQIGSGQQTASGYRPLPTSESNRPLNQGTSFPKQGQDNQINKAFGAQQGKLSGQGYQYQPQRPSLGFSKPTLINSAGSHNEGTSNQPSYNDNNNQNQGPQSSFYGSSKQEFQQSGKKPSFGSSDSPSQNSQFFNTIQKGALANNQAGQSPQFPENPNQSSFNYNQTPDKLPQYQQTGNQASSGNRQPAQSSKLPSGSQGFGTNTLTQRPTAGSRPVQAPYQYNKPSQSFKPEPSNFLPLESPSSKGKPAQGNQDRNEEFGGPRQPPSFSSQEGYKY